MMLLASEEPYIFSINLKHTMNIIIQLDFFLFDSQVISKGFFYLFIFFLERGLIN